jgi:hypothetical protein
MVARNLGSFSVKTWCTILARSSISAFLSASDFPSDEATSDRTISMSSAEAFVTLFAEAFFTIVGAFLSAICAFLSLAGEAFFDPSL